MSDSIGFGIVGLGMAAELHTQGIAANAEQGAHLVAMASRTPGVARERAQKFGAPCVSFEELLANPEVRVVCLCTPSGQHAGQALRVARAGKHLLVEKPMALSLGDADAMIDAFEGSGLLLGVALQRRAEPMFQRIAQAIHKGDLGEPTLGIVTIPYFRGMSYYNLADWRGTWAQDGGGVLMNQGYHLVDLLVWFMGEPVDVSARAATLVRDIEVEDTLAATLRFPNGALATIAATSTAEPGFPHRVEVYGTKGGVQVDGENVSRWELAAPESTKVPPWHSAVQQAAGAGGDPRGVGASGHAKLIANFMRTLRGKDTLAADGREGRRALKVIQECYTSAGML